jgi:hypothetical protein
VTAQFAIPATSFVLREIVQRRINLAYQGFTAPTVSIEPPPRPPATAANPTATPQPEPAALHLFLHHAGPNPAWRNMYEPHVSSEGTRVGPSPIAVDLQYMLAASGADLEREVLLGLGITALTRHGIVPRPLIQSILGAIAVPPNPTRLLDRLTAEPLHDPAMQPEQITVSLAPVDVDLSTKIWSALQSPMRPTVYFLATTIFLDVDETFALAPTVSEAHLAARPEADPASILAADIAIVTEAP